MLGKVEQRGQQRIYEKKNAPFAFGRGKVDPVHVEASRSAFVRGKDVYSIRTSTECSREAGRDGHEIVVIPIRLASVQGRRYKYLNK
jgi:hypothetical protein